MGGSAITCAYTHAAARLVEGITIASLLFLDTKLQHAWILIDEVSLIPIDTMGMLARAKLVGAKFVCFGDFEGQFDAMKDRWNRVRAIQDSECMKDMCNRMHFHLTTYWRGTDRALFDFYTQLYCESDEELPFIVQQAQKTYPVKLFSPVEFDVVLCVSHANRMLVNRRGKSAHLRDALSDVSCRMVRRGYQRHNQPTSVNDHLAWH